VTDLDGGYRLDRDAITRFEYRSLSSKRSDRREMAGMCERRIDSAGPGPVVLHALTETLGIGHLTVSRGVPGGDHARDAPLGRSLHAPWMEAEEPAA
jgi:exopolyphosphatase/pppGpp-phosphohydrolase